MSKFALSVTGGAIPEDTPVNRFSKAIPAGMAALDIHNGTLVLAFGFLQAVGVHL